MHWSCRSRSSSACKVIFIAFIIDIINIIVSIIVATINLYRFLGDVSGLAEFVDDKVTICLCSNLLHLTRTPSSLIVMIMIILNIMIITITIMISITIMITRP